MNIVEKRADELVIANSELAFQNQEKEKRAAELVLANEELKFQNEEKEKRAAELVIANSELAFQNQEKEKRAAELVLANEELKFQNEEKEKRAAELVIANTELAFQNEEKEKRAAELVIVNTELTLQNREKEKRAAELAIADRELAFQNIEKEKRAAELIGARDANKELEAFSYSVSHDLRAPLRGIDSFSRIVLEDYGPQLDDEGRRLLNVICGEAKRMGQLIDDLLAFSRMGRQDMSTTKLDMTQMLQNTFDSLDENTRERVKHLNMKPLPPAFGDHAMIKQVLFNLVANAVKFAGNQPEILIEIGATSADGFNTYFVKDNGVGFDQKFVHKLFGVFQRLHTQEEFEGTGVGLALVQRIIHRHGGKVWAEGKINAGATFYFSLPNRKES